MKNLLLSAMLLSFLCSAFAQSSPETYLPKIPSFPDNACSLNNEERSDYSERIDKLYNDITTDIRQKRKEANANAKQSEEKVKQNMAKQYGLSEADMERMKNMKNLSEAEKKELMQKMMKAGAQNIPDQKKSMSTYELTKEQKTLTDKITAAENDFQNKLKQLDETDTAATKELAAVKEPLLKELYTINDGEGGTEADAVHRKNVINKIRESEEKYCARMTPLYIELLKDRLSTLKSLMPDYKRLQEVLAELNKNTAGIEKDIAPEGLMQLEAIEEYLQYHKDVFKYCRYSVSNE